MNKDTISSLEFGITSTYLLKVFIFVNGINILLNINKSDSIISILIGILLGFFLLKIFIFLKDRDIFDTIDKSSSKITSTILKIILLICSISMSCYILYSISLFIKTSLLNKVDILPISILFISTCFYSYKKGIKTIVKSAFLSFFIFLLLEVISFLFLTPNIDSTKILPLATYDIFTTIKGSIIYLILSFSPLFLMLCIPHESKNKSFKIYYIVTNIFILFSFILVLSVVDSNIAVMIDYPALFILSKIEVINFFDRMENILSFKFLFDSIFSLSILLFYISSSITSITKIYNIKKNKNNLNKYLNYLSLIIIIFLSNFIEFNNSIIFTTLILFSITNIIIGLKKFLKRNTLS